MEREPEAKAKEWASTRIADPTEVTERLAKPRAQRRASPRPDTPLGKRLEREEAESTFVVRMPVLADDEDPGPIPVAADGETPWDSGDPLVSPLRRRAVLTAHVLGVTAMALAVIAAATLVLGPRLIGYQLQTVPGGRLALETAIQVAEVNIGDLLTFTAPTGEVVTHRVIQSITAPGGAVSIRTRADGGPIDPWLAQLDGRTVWKERVTLPLLGLPVAALRALSTLLLVLLPLTALVWAGALYLNRPSRDPQRGQPRNIPGVAPARADLVADALPAPRSGTPEPS